MQKLKPKKYHPRLTWIIFLVLAILLGLFFGLVLDLGTGPRTVIGLILFCLWFWIDWTMRKKFSSDED